MAGTQQIPNLPIGLALNGTEQLWMVQQGVDKRVTTSQLNDYFLGNVPRITIVVGQTVVQGTANRVLYIVSGSPKNLVGEMTTSGNGTQLALTNSPTLTTPNLTSYTVATLPAGSVGQLARVTDGTAALAWGATVTSGGATPYLVWFNGSNWTVVGK